MIHRFLQILSNNAAAGALAGVVIVILLVFGSTFVYTKLRFRLSSLNYEAQKHQGKEPPALPYYIPWVGSILEYLVNPHGFLKSAK